MLHTEQKEENNIFNKNIICFLVIVIFFSIPTSFANSDMDMSNIETISYDESIDESVAIDVEYYPEDLIGAEPFNFVNYDGNRSDLGKGLLILDGRDIIYHNPDLFPDIRELEDQKELFQYFDIYKYGQKVGYWAILLGLKDNNELLGDKPIHITPGLDWDHIKERATVLKVIKDEQEQLAKEQKELAEKEAQLKLQEERLKLQQECLKNLSYIKYDGNKTDLLNGFLIADNNGTILYFNQTSFAQMKKVFNESESLKNNYIYYQGEKVSFDWINRQLDIIFSPTPFNTVMNRNAISTYQDSPNNIPVEDNSTSEFKPIAKAEVNKTGISNTSVGEITSTEKTGNPIFILLLALISCIVIRRKN